MTAARGPAEGPRGYSCVVLKVRQRRRKASRRARGEDARKEDERRTEMKADWKLDTKPTQALRQKVTQGLEWSRRASGAVTAGAWAATLLSLAV